MKRILAIDLRSARIGFAVFELPNRLLDWGKRAITADSCSPILSRLLRKYGVNAIAIRRIAVNSRRDTVRVRNGLRIVRRTARQRGIELVVLSEKAVNYVLSQGHHLTRYEMAYRMVTIFPELERYLPGPRRFYNPENKRMSAFDAVVLGVTFLASQPENISLRERLATAGTLSPASR